ncbi:MAG: hypothetical protein M0Q26_09870 [Chitinophagaceae bacterium]|nr:hypothetical protein [Chitinophagaceae bacterium]
MLLGLNGGKNIYFKNPKWFISFYGGGGYLNVGEPKVTVDPTPNIATQDAVRKSSLFARSGTRLAYKTGSSFFQTVFIDGSHWISPAKVQGGNVNGFSFYIGPRFGVIQ